MRVTVIGSGYVGLVVGACLADSGNDVVCADVDARKVVKTEESKVSMMPPGLLYMLKEDDILDLMAYLLSKGNPDDPMFVK